MCIAVEETDIEGILAAINTIELIVEIRSEKNSAQLTSAIPVSALPTELTSQLGVVYYVGSHNLKKNMFSWITQTRAFELSQRCL